MRFSTFFLLIIVISTPATAHTGFLKGRVSDSKTTAAIPGVSVSLAGTRLGAITNSEGYFIIPGVPTGSYDVTASAIGFKKKSLRVTISTEDTASIQFALPSDILTFPAIAVEADRPGPIEGPRPASEGRPWPTALGSS